MPNKRDILLMLLVNTKVKEGWPTWAKFSFEEFINIIATEQYALSKELNQRGLHISQVLDIFWPSRPKGGSPKICNYILGSGGYKHCPKCHTTKPLEDFGVEVSKLDGKANWCKECYRLKGVLYRKDNPELSKQQSINNYYTHKSDYVARNIKYKTRRELATPAWANLETIRQIYDCAEGDHVDHIIPLQGELVCGLHVENNLQYLSPEENIKKSNSFEIQ
jgi:hypothetical protein